MNVPFVFSSNGHQFVEYDRFTRLTSQPRPMSEFPTPDEVRLRYEQGMQFSLSDEAAKPLLTPYDGGEAGRRYYQDAAIRAVFEKVAQSQATGEAKRALLTLATGAGKTFIAVHLLKRIADAGQLGRALFVCDRDELRTQGLAALQNVFGNEAAAVSTGNAQKNARVVVATYQTLGVDSDEADATFLLKHYPENYFTHIVIDECHRSAWGKWITVLTRNPDAVQIGLTATPRKIELPKDCTEEAKTDALLLADNIKYFGKPVYDYSITQGMEDGYLALCDMQKGRVNLDDTGITMDQILARKPVDARTGQPITRDQLKALYKKNTFEKQVLLPDRVWAMCADLFAYLLKTGGPEQKSIIFCARDQHADDVAVEMNNLYENWCQEQGRQPLDVYAFKCTDKGGKADLPSLKGQTRSHFIATTVDLLTTGVDVPALRNIAFFRYVNSPISFYQMVGRGTRIDPVSGKLMFHLYDYTNATDLFGSQFITKPTPPKKPGGGTDPPPPPPPPQPIVRVKGFDVQVTDAGKFILADVDGASVPITIESYKERLGKKLIQEVASIAGFRKAWIVQAARKELFGKLPDAGRSPLLIQQLEQMQEYDLYDVLAEIGYGLAPRTREQRAEAFEYKHADWLKGMPTTSADVLRAIVAQFAKAGTDGLENQNIFQTPDVQKAGGKTGAIDALRELGKPAQILTETKSRLFAA